MKNIKNVNLGQYAPRDSIIHSLDPRIKILFCFILMFLIFFTHKIEILCFLSILIIILYYLAKLKFSLALKNIRPFFFLFLLTVILHGFFTPGRILLTIPVINGDISLEGLYKGFFYTFRLIILIILAGLLTLTTSPMSLTDGMERFLKPFKKLGLPAHEIAMTISIAMRFIPILIEESERIKKAQISRGAKFEGNIINRTKSIIPLVVPLFISGFRKANELSLAMEARGYKGGQGRTSYLYLALGKNDFICLCILFFLTLLIIGYG
ncbi:MAG: energy-coupling factor transporter transmembrane component T [bacterium]